MFSSTLVHAYDYENQRRKQARDSGKLLTAPKQKETQSKEQKAKEKKLSAKQRKMNLEKRRSNSSIGKVNIKDFIY